MPILNVDKAPKSTNVDESTKVAITHFHHRIRVGAMAEIAGFDLMLDGRGRETLEVVTDDLYPAGGYLKNATSWTGLRPATPDSTPTVGAILLRNLLVNTGHGTLGWTMACGSARVLADQIASNTPKISTAGLDMSQYTVNR